MTLNKVSSPSAEQLLAVAIVAADAAGAVLVERLDRPIELTHKNERTSVVTDVDVAAQRAIERIIAEHFPDHAILGEEGCRNDENAALTWLVDPLDGTSNYAKGIPLACVSVAVRDDAGVVAGAVFEPFRRELFTAVRKGGAWLGTSPIGVSTTDDLAQAVVCTGVQSDDPEAVTAFGRRVVDLTSHCRAVRLLGSPALCLAYVSAGRIDAYLEADSTSAWDVGAGALLVMEAGGAIEDLDGGPLNLGLGVANVLASNGQVHEALRSVLGHVPSAATT